MPEIEDLRMHLADRYGFRAQATFAFDRDVVLLRPDRGPSWVVRIFPPERPLAAIEGDAEILRWLAANDYPAERCATDEPVSVLAGCGMLVTEAVAAVPRAQRREMIKDAGGVRALGELLGVLHTLPRPVGAAARPGGAWHHATEGAPRAELAVAAEWLEQAEADAPARDLGLYTTISEELDALDDGAGLPEALIHPDFVLANVVATSAPGMVLVDWTGAGVGPRAWALAFLLWAEGAKDPRRAALAFAGYRNKVALTPAELDRLPGMIRARPLIFDIWRLRNGAQSAASVAQNALETRQSADTLAARLRAWFADGQPR